MTRSPRATAPTKEDRRAFSARSCVASWAKMGADMVWGYQSTRVPAAAARNLAEKALLRLRHDESNCCVVNPALTAYPLECVECVDNTASLISLLMVTIELVEQSSDTCNLGRASVCERARGSAKKTKSRVVSVALRSLSFQEELRSHSQTLSFSFPSQPVVSHECVSLSLSVLTLQKSRECC